MTKHRTCPSCGCDDTVLVWESKERWKQDKPPKFIGCEDCHIMER